MSKHYQDIVDEVFCENYPHRTLRTVFDPFSSEWTETNMDKKVEILKKIVESGKTTVPDLIDDYCDYYTNELANKKHVVSSIEGALATIIQHLLCKK